MPPSRRANRRLRLAATASCSLLLAAGCWAPGKTTRIVEGRKIVGREVPDAAYDAYVRAAYLESRGDLDRAVEAYEIAIDADGDSPELYTRLGALLCRLKRGEALDAFEEALDLDDKYAPAYREVAECFRRRRHNDQALVNARRAVALAPLDVEANLLTARILEAGGNRREARRWYRSLALQAPHNRTALRATIAFALRTKDEPLKNWTERQLRQFDAAHELPRTESRRPPLETEDATDAVSAALETGDLAQAQGLAQAAGLTPAAVAIQALKVGALDEARQQARLVYRANPADSDARIALLVAGQRGDDAQLEREALTQSTRARRPGPDAAALFARQLRLFVSEAAAERFERAYEELLTTPPAPHDKPPLPKGPKRVTPPAPTPRDDAPAETAAEGS